MENALKIYILVLCVWVCTLAKNAEWPTAKRAEKKQRKEMMKSARANENKTKYFYQKNEEYAIFFVWCKGVFSPHAGLSNLGKSAIEV